MKVLKLNYVLQRVVFFSCGGAVFFYRGKKKLIFEILTILKFNRSQVLKFAKLAIHVFNHLFFLKNSILLLVVRSTTLISLFYFCEYCFHYTLDITIPAEYFHAFNLFFFSF